MTTIKVRLCDHCQAELDGEAEENGEQGSWRLLGYEAVGGFEEFDFCSLACLRIWLTPAPTPAHPSEEADRG